VGRIDADPRSAPRKRRVGLSEDVKAIAWKSAAPAPRSPSEAARSWQVPAAFRDRGGTRAPRIHLGHQRGRGNLGGKGATRNGQYAAVVAPEAPVPSLIAEAMC